MRATQTDGAGLAGVRYSILRDRGRFTWVAHVNSGDAILIWCHDWKNWDQKQILPTNFPISQNAKSDGRVKPAHDDVEIAYKSAATAARPTA
jgi:hypothetical protein